MALTERGLYACYQRLERPLFDVLYRMLWNRHECQDLMHDAFLRVWQRRDQVDADRVESLVWVSALNLARNRLRWQRLWRTETFDVEWPDSAATPEQSVDSAMQQRRLHAALKSLPAAMRDVVLLSEFAELSQAEIAKMLKIPAGTVASRRHHALNKLRTLLTEDDHD
ncbi:MAG: RNA polymerase sigma factor [Gammaproteobacteria bacterium]